MHKVLVLGAGNIGSLIACLLAGTKDYSVFLADIKKPKLSVKLSNLKSLQIDIAEKKSAEKIIRELDIQAVISCLPYFLNPIVADLAKKNNLHYFDLTEDVAVTDYIKKLAKSSRLVFMPQCGLAPGFVNILANDIMKKFDRLENVELRVGDLPIGINNALQYALTWSTDGLINEYGNVAYGIVEGKQMPLQPLEDLEAIEVDGKTYEAFNTSGGIGSLISTYSSKVKNLNYKTIRYPGHCDKMRFLMKDLKLNEDRPTLKKILERVLPHTAQDVALIYVSVTGYKHEQLMNETYINKIYPQQFFTKPWTAIQTTTAAGLCAVVDIVLNNLNRYRGFVLQENIELKDFLNNRFGKIFARK